MKHPALDAATRSIFGKQVDRLRRSGIIPGVVYGRGARPQPVQVNSHQFQDAYRRAGSSSLVDLFLPGQTGPVQVLIQEVQRDHVSRAVVHVDFHQVNPAEEVEVELPIVLVGEAPAEAGGAGVLIHGVTHIRVRGRAEDMPSHIELDASQFTALDEPLHVRDLSLPPGIELAGDPDEVVGVVTHARAPVAELRPEEAASAPPAEARPAKLPAGE